MEGYQLVELKVLLHPLESSRGCDNDQNGCKPPMPSLHKISDSLENGRGSELHR